MHGKAEYPWFQTYVLVGSAVIVYYECHVLQSNETIIEDRYRFQLMH